MMPNPADTPDADDLRAARLLQQALARPGEILEIEPSSPPGPSCARAPAGCRRR